MQSFGMTLIKYRIGRIINNIPMEINIFFDCSLSFGKWYHQNTAKVETAKISKNKNKRQQQQNRKKNSKIRLIAYVFLLLSWISVKCWLFFYRWHDMERAVIYLMHHKIDSPRNTSTYFGVYKSSIGIRAVNPKFFFGTFDISDTLCGFFLLLLFAEVYSQIFPTVFIYENRHLSMVVVDKCSFTHPFDRISNNWKDRKQCSTVPPSEAMHIEFNANALQFRHGVEIKSPTPKLIYVW